MATLSRTPSPAAGSDSESDFAVATPQTPRTKLRELFATIDDGDSSGSDREREDGDENKTPSRKARKPSSGKVSAKVSPKLAGASAVSRLIGTNGALQNTSANRTRATSPLKDALASSSNDDSDVEVRPRGRFASRMQAATNNQAAPAPAALPAPENATVDAVAAEPLAGNARERVKRMLQQAAAAEKQKQQGEVAVAAKDHEDTTIDAEGTEDDEDAPVVAAARPRKRLMNQRPSRRNESLSPRQASSSSPRTRADSPGMFMTPTKLAHGEEQHSPGMFVTPEPTTVGGDGNGVSAEEPNPGRKARFQALVARKREELRARTEAEEQKSAAREAAMADDNNSQDGGADDDDDMLMRDADDDDVSDISDDEGGRRLTQDAAGARPAARKASKKALEDMHRETQRMSRNLQLAHEAKTKKKITKATLFERFNFKPAGSAVPAPAAVPVAQEHGSSSRPSSPVSARNHTDADLQGSTDTPPSSPPAPVAPDMHLAKITEAVLTTEAAAATNTPLDKGKGKAIEIPAIQTQPPLKRQVRVRMPVTVPTNLVMFDSDEDGELEIVQTTKSKLDALFDNVPLKRENEPRSLLALRRLAQISSPGKKQPRGRNVAKGAKSRSVTLGELQQNLQERARLQAKLEREQRLERLRAKGVRIQTEEEREKEMEEVDDIVARAREEAEELMQRERKEAKKEKEARGGDGEEADSNADPLDWDESEDEEGSGDYQPEEEEEEEEGGREIELSGSEDGADEEAEEDEVMEGVLIDGEAESGAESEDGKDDEEADNDALSGAADILPTPIKARRATNRRAALVISDDEEDEDGGAATTATPLAHAAEAKTPGPKSVFAKSPAGFNNNSDSPQVPTSVLRSATKPFIPGLPVAVGGPAGLGLTQIFAGTLADNSQLSGSAGFGGFGSPSQLMPTFGNFVDVDNNSATAPAVLDSQPTQEWIKRMQGGGESNTDSNAGGDSGPSQMVQLNFSQSQVHGLDSLLQDTGVSQMSDLLLGPSQDTGTQEFTPLKVRFIEHQPLTIETVVLGEQTQLARSQSQLQSQPPAQVLSPLQAAPARSKGRLFRKTDMVKIVEEEEDEDEADEEVEEGNRADEIVEEASAFSKMRQAAAQKLFNRKKSKAKEMVEEQAEESEDEYAGLGGADGEDSDDESLASVKDIIDDDQRVSSTDSARLAAFYADREREHDEKQVEKLFRDVTTGMLRRKRGAGGGADYDLSDSDDGGEARRRMKRRQFARMQKALFADERISKVAENPRNQAFLRTIEDRGSDEEMDFIFDKPAAPAPAAEATAASASAVAIPDSQPTTAEQQPQQHRQPRRHHRRVSVTNGKKPSNIGEIRETLSSLLEDDYHGLHVGGSNLSVIADSQYGGSDEENDGGGGASGAGSNKENVDVVARSQQAGVRRPGRSHNVQVVDRIALKRQNSTSSNSSSGSSSIGANNPAAASAAGAASAASGPFAASSMGPTGFRVPALLRRATTNSIMSNGSASSCSSSSNSAAGSGAGMARATGAGGDGRPDDGKIKKNASKMSGIHFFARENERRAALAVREERRQAKKARSAAGRSRAVGGLFGAGKFE